FALRNRIRRGQVDRSAEIVPFDQPLDGSAEIVTVDPRDELFSSGYRSSKAKPCQGSKDPKDAALSRSEDDRAPQCDFACRRGLGLVECFFPSPSYFN